MQTLGTQWRKSSYSGNGGQNCVEVGVVPWRKSSHSGHGGMNCVEVGVAPGRKPSYSGNGGVNCVEVGVDPSRESSYSQGPACDLPSLHTDCQSVNVPHTDCQSVNVTHTDRRFVNVAHTDCRYVSVESDSQHAGSAAPWRKSTHSGNGGQGCVEAAGAPGAILIRDTKDNGAGPVLRMTPGAWQDFTARIRASKPCR